MAKHLIHTAALAAVAALSLSACGSGSGGSDDIKGAHKGSKGDGSPTASATADPKTDFKLPKDVKVEISADKTGNKKKDAVLAAQANILTALESAYTEPKLTSSLLDVYFTDDSHEFYRKDIAKVHAKHVRDTGKYRYFNRKVTTLSEDIAVVKYCGDQSQVSSRDTRTGHVKKDDGPSSRARAGFTSVLRKNPTSHLWQEQSFESKVGASECQ